MAEEKKIATGYIGNALRSSAADHTTTFTDEVFDTERQKYQSEVNTDIEGKIVTEQERAEAAEQANAQAITDEAQAREKAEANMKGMILANDASNEVKRIASAIVDIKIWAATEYSQDIGITTFGLYGSNFVISCYSGSTNIGSLNLIENTTSYPTEGIITYEKKSSGYGLFYMRITLDWSRYNGEKFNGTTRNILLPNAESYNSNSYYLLNNDIVTAFASLNRIEQKVEILQNAGYLFKGVATIDTNPETPDAKVFYIANGKGIYTNFGGLEVTEDEVVILCYDTTWHKVATGIASQEKLTELGQKIENLLADYTPSEKYTEVHLDINKTYTIEIVTTAQAVITLGYANIAASEYVTNIKVENLVAGKYSFDFVVNSKCNYIVAASGNDVSMISNIKIVEKDWTPKKAIEKESTDRINDVESVRLVVNSAITSKPSDNLLDINNPKRGYLYSSSAYFTDGTSGMWLSNIINVEGKQNITIEIANTLQPSTTSAAAFSANENISSYIGGLKTISFNHATLDVPEGAKYLIVIIANSQDGYNYILQNGTKSQIQFGDSIVSHDPYGYVVELKGKTIDEINKSLTKVAYVGAGCEFSSILDALKNTLSSTKIIVKKGTYDIYQEYLDYYGNDFWDNYDGYNGKDDEFLRGLWLGDNRVIEGESGVTLIWDCKSTNGTILSEFSMFATKASNNAIINMTLVSKGHLRYIVHDDYTGYYDPRPNGFMKYENVIFKGTCNRGPNYPLIGGGSGYFNTYIVKDCVFLNTNEGQNINDASWHNHNGQATDTKCLYYVSGCYGKNNLIFQSNGGATIKSECYVSNCKFNSIKTAMGAEATIENMELTKWNCTEVE